MKVIKENSSEYLPFSKMLEELTGNYTVPKTHQRTMQHSKHSKADVSYFEKYNYIFSVITMFERDTANLTDDKKIFLALQQSLKKILPSKETSLLFFDQNFSTLLPIDKGLSVQLDNTINSYYKEGILNIVFDSRMTTILPLLSSYESEGPKYNILIIPLYEGVKRRGLLALLTTSKEEMISEFDKKLAESLVYLALAKIDKCMLTKKVNSLYEDLRTYQAKVNNEYKMTAVGGMTEGIVSDILSPLQVIMSQIDLMVPEIKDNFEVDLLKAQIEKINQTVSRLVKFANTNSPEIKVEPCDLNKVINDFFQIIKSTLENNRIEFVLDLQKDLPAILSNPNHINQILANLFGIIKIKSSGEAAIIIQTKAESDSIIMKIISSAILIDKDNKEADPAIKLNLKVINDIMEKHEGKVTVVTSAIGSTVVTFNFPLRRKIRK